MSPDAGLLRKVTHTDTKAGIEYTFNSPELDQLLHGYEGQAINYKIQSTNGKKSKTLKSQREHVIEFMKVLSLAHECVPETVQKNDGSYYTFF